MARSTWFLLFAAGASGAPLPSQFMASIPTLRRLTAKNSTAPSAECLQACPAVAEVYDEVKAAMEASEQNPSESFKVACENKDAMACYAKTAACQDGDPLESSTMGMLDCICDACPSVVSIMSPPASDMNEEEGLKYMCSLMGPMECIQKEPSKCAAFSQMMSADGSGSSPKYMCSLMGPMECIQREPSKCAAVKQMMSRDGSSLEQLLGMKSLCERTGGDNTEDMTCGMVAYAYEQSGCCGNPRKKIEMPDTQFRRLQAVPPVSKTIESTMAAKMTKHPAGTRKLAMVLKSLGEKYS
eukprot:TRINITY_DN5120_c0_g1_i8.p1 TRINITY_DN5120_c0_g1~~TRINITY_DN5120_c0_g1_i8.p1  ORF type:complete len:298 (-),score=52.78 TRINITY_DN5120_c0_g1_i8:156-1049(-)